MLFLSACSKKEEDPEAHARSPEDSLKTIHIREGFHAELFAAEPDVMSPVEMAFDENGKIYVAEMLDYPDDPPAGKPARSRIRLLEDATATESHSRRRSSPTIVLAVSGFMPWKGGLIVTSAPDILYLKDTDGDGKADVRKVLYTGFPKVESREPHHQPDGSASTTGSIARTAETTAASLRPITRKCRAVLVRGADFRFDPISGKAEAASGPAQFGSTIDEFGNRYISQNTTHIRHVVVPMQYLARAPLLEVSATAQDISDHGRPSAPMYPADRSAASGARSAPSCASSATTRTSWTASSS